jgi:hypothetical protein
LADAKGSVFQRSQGDVVFSLSHRFFEPFKALFSSFFSLTFLLLFVTLTMLLPANIAHCVDLSFAWDKNTESDLAGYYIYYKTGSSGAPYDGIGADEGNSPIQIPLANLSDPENPEYTIHGLSDTEASFFVITSYDTANNESDHSNELSFQPSSQSSSAPTLTSSSESGSSSGCFIATAAFGSKFEKHVQILRQFRDVYLLPYGIGRALVNAYYRYSPPVADFIADHETIQTMVRWSLLPLAGLSWILLHLGIVTTLLLLALISSTTWVCYIKIRHVGGPKKRREIFSRFLYACPQKHFLSKCYGRFKTGHILFH